VVVVRRRRTSLGHGVGIVRSVVMTVVGVALDRGHGGGSRRARGRDQTEQRRDEGGQDECHR
jgi:hypothetical protein